MTVCIVTAELDPTADEVVLALENRGMPVFRIDRAWFPTKVALEAEFRDGIWKGYLRTAEHAVALEEIRSVWYRWRSAFRLPPRMSEQDQAHAEREARTGFDGVLAALDALHVNHPHRIAALPKPMELAVAARCGLAVPPTLVGNSPHAVRAFAEKWSPVARKLFSCHVPALGGGPDLMGHTRVVTAEDLTEVDQVAVTAHQVQAFIDKRCDVRVVVIGDNVTAVAMHPGSPAARVDFRSDYRSLEYEVIDLPEDIHQGITRFMTTTGLHLASFDFVVDHTDRFWFLESNPAGGQYAWLQSKTGVPLAETVADLLAGGQR